MPAHLVSERLKERGVRDIPARARRGRAPLHRDPPRAHNLVPSIENIRENLHAPGQRRRHQRPLHAPRGHHLDQHRVYTRPHRRHLGPASPRARLVPSEGVRGEGERLGEVDQSSRAAVGEIRQLSLKKRAQVEIRLARERRERGEIDGGGELRRVVA